LGRLNEAGDEDGDGALTEPGFKTVSLAIKGDNGKWIWFKPIADEAHPDYRGVRVGDDGSVWVLSKSDDGTFEIEVGLDDGEEPPLWWPPGLSN
jgi:hypothetical protein